MNTKLRQYYFLWCGRRFDTIEKAEQFLDWYVNIFDGSNPLILW